MRILPGITYTGKISEFGGPLDRTMTFDEGLAMINSVEDCPELFLPEPPPLLATDPGYPGICHGLARRLDPSKNYVACRWDYSVTPKSILRRSNVVVSHGLNKVICKITDFGPHEDTGRIIDASPAVLRALGVQTDDVVKFYLNVPKI